MKQTKLATKQTDEQFSSVSELKENQEKIIQMLLQLKELQNLLNEKEMREAENFNDIFSESLEKLYGDYNIQLNEVNNAMKFAKELYDFLNVQFEQKTK